MIKIISYILENWSTYTLGYWPEIFPNPEEHIYNLSIFITVYLSAFIIVNIIHFIVAFRGYSHKYYIYTSLAYIILNAFINFAIFFVAFNMFGIVLTYAISSGWMICCAILEILDDDDEINGIFKIMRLSKDYSLVLKEYYNKRKEWKQQYNELLNF